MGTTRRQLRKAANKIRTKVVNDTYEAVPSYGTSDSSSDPEETPQKVLRLKKEVGLFSSITLLLGCIIGTGIFVSPGTVLKNAGSVEIALLVWTAAGLNSLIGAFCFVELGALLPASGGDYAYFSAAGKALGKYGDFPAFLYAWSCMTMLDPTSISVEGLTFSAYVLSLLYPECTPPSGATVLIALLYIIAANAANSFSVSISARVQDIFSGLKCTLLLVIIMTGTLYSFKVNHIKDPSYSSGNISPGDVAAAFYGAAYTYSGWRAVNNIAEEVKNPARNIPLAVFASVVITTAAYLLTNLAFFIAMDADTIIASDAIAVTFIRSTWGPSLSVLVPLIISLSLFGSTCAEIFVSARITFAAARQGHLASFLSYIHVNTAVPLASIITRCVLSLLYTMTGSVTFLIEACVLFETTWDIASVVALLILRRSMSKTTRTIRVPTFLVFLRLVICIAMATVPLSQVHRYRYHYIAVLVTCLSGMIYYVAFVRLKMRLPGGDAASVIMQKCLNSAACVNELDLILRHRSESEASLIRD
uniref:Putative amino acid transporter n=1 Tax=Ixodes ricinus TaxID=34613 RepID=A0A0K8RMA4_IXORI